MFKSSVSTQPKIGPLLTYRPAKIPLQFENIRVIVGSEEQIFGDVYVYGLVENDRMLKFRKSALEFK